MLNAINRIRHGRGFGVHSPFAYRFITQVLRERCPYYDYDVVRGHAERLLYRIAVFFQPQTLRAPQAGANIVKLAVPSASCDNSTPSPDMAVYDTAPETSEVLALLDRETVIVLAFKRDKALMAAIADRLDSLGYGMVFDNERSFAIVVARKRLPRQYFNAKF